MSLPKIIVFAGSLRTHSFNQRLAALAAKELTIAGAEVTRISLGDFPLPLYDADSEAKDGLPANAIKLKQMIAQHHGVFIASPEYNASITPLLKNSLDWVSRVREGGSAFKDRIFALGAASNGQFGGLRSLMALRQVLELGCGALVLPDQVAVSRAADAFDEMDNLKDDRAAAQLRNVLARLFDWSRQLA